MIDRNELRELHKQDLPLHVLEQDYIQSLFLAELYERTEDLVFKGGTFLKHAHGLDRFSEDLDFTAKNNPDTGILQDTADALADYGIEAEIDSIEDKEISFTCRLRYKGPLFDGDERLKGSIDIEISKRDDVLSEPEWVRLFFEYPETRVVNVLGLNKKELLAEKLRALSTRDKARDLYDCWFLLKQGTELDRELFEEKMGVVGAKPVVSIEFDPEDWKAVLEIFLQNPPSYENVKKELIESLETEGFEVDEQV